MIPVTVERVCKRYGQVEALRDVTLAFEPGDTLLLADSPEPGEEGLVTVRIALDRLRVYVEGEH